MNYLLIYSALTYAWGVNVLHKRILNIKTLNVKDLILLVLSPLSMTPLFLIPILSSMFNLNYIIFRLK